MDSAGIEMVKRSSAVGEPEAAGDGKSLINEEISWSEVVDTLLGTNVSTILRAMNIVIVALSLVMVLSFFHAREPIVRVLWLVGVALVVGLGGVTNW